MKREDYDRINAEIQQGQEKYVENLDTHYTGKVVGLSDDRIEVDVAGRHESWSMDRCQETMGSQFGHREKSLDTHPWDTDRFNPYT